MMIKELKEYIFKNNKIEYILDNIGCHNIKYHPSKDYYSCSNYNGDNPTAVNVKNNEYLIVTNWTRQKEFDSVSDIITLVQYNRQCNFIDAVKYLHDILGLEYNPSRISSRTKDNKKKEHDPNAILKKIVATRKQVNVDDIHVLDDAVLHDYVPILHINMFREGIMPWTAKKFGLAYSYRYKRVVIPLRYWLTGDLLGVNMRTTVDNYKELGILKYFITPSYQKGMNLFGLYENYDEIQKAKSVVVYESEKSVLKRDSLRRIDEKNGVYDYSNGVALSGHTMSDEQISILISLNVDIIIALDKDIDINEVRHMCEQFYGIRRVYYIYDKYNLLGEKDSPADADNARFRYLMKHKVEYDKAEHEKYIKSLKLNK